MQKRKKQQVTFMVGWSSTLASASGMTFGGDEVKPTQGCKWGQEEREIQLS